MYNFMYNYVQLRYTSLKYKELYMARKNPRIKVPDVKEVYYSYDKDNRLEYHVRFKPKLKNPFPFKNYTEIFNLYDLPEKEHLKEVRKKLDYVHSKYENEGIYHIDEVTGKLAKEEAKKIEALEQKKIDVLFDSIFNMSLAELSHAETTRKTYLANYNRHIKPFLGGKSVYDIKYIDVEAIFKRMDDKERNGTGKNVTHKVSGKILMKNPKKKLSLQTKKNVLTIFRNVFNYLVEDDEQFKDFNFNPAKKMLKKLNDDYKNKKNDEVAYESLTHRLKITSHKDMLNIVRRIYQEITKLAQPKLNKNGKEVFITTDIYRTKAYFFASLMCARRISELQRIDNEDINKDFIFVKAKKSKNNKADEYPLPPEVLELINLEDKYPLKIAYGTANRNWHNIKKAIGMSDKEMRQYDFRALFVSTMEKFFDRHSLGLCISHKSGDNVKSNDFYFNITPEKKREIFEKYWELLREPIST